MRALAAGFILALPAPAAQAQGGDGGFGSQLPTTYEACMSTATFPMLVEAGAKHWGFSPEQGADAVNLLAGYYQCKAFVEDDEDACAPLGGIDGLSVANLLDADCRRDHHLLRLHSALEHKDYPDADRHCRRWCEDYVQAQFRLDCPRLCKTGVDVIRTGSGSACREMSEVVPAGISRVFKMYCTLTIAPSRETCGQPQMKEGDFMRAVEGFSQERSLKFDKQRFARYESAMKEESRLCDVRRAFIAALAEKDRRLCPKDKRHRMACRAAFAKAPMAECRAAARYWTRLFCDRRKATGGLRQDEAEERERRRIEKEEKKTQKEWRRRHREEMRKREAGSGKGKGTPEKSAPKTWEERLQEVGEDVEEER
ncbi:MAG: hypothetical protein ABII00_09440 [Elusimicrobiota bacterium]